MKPLKSKKVQIFRAVLKPVERQISHQSKNKHSDITRPVERHISHQSKNKHSDITRLLTRFRNKKGILTEKSSQKNIPTRDDILSGIVINFPRALKLLLFLENFKDVIFWDRDKRLVLYNTPISGTNFIDLLNTILNPSGTINNNPGMSMFIHALKSVNVPASLVVNKKVKEELKK